MTTDLKLNALHTIFEKHLYDLNAEHTSEKDLVEQVVADYLKFLNQQRVTVPKKWEAHIRDELHVQVRSMVLKTIYGAMTPKEFVQKKKDRKKKHKTALKKFLRLY